jgi:hypothetical protein
MGRMKETLYRTSGEERYDRTGGEAVKVPNDGGITWVDVDDEPEETRQPEAR